MNLVASVRAQQLRIGPAMRDLTHGIGAVVATVLATGLVHVAVTHHGPAAPAAPARSLARERVRS